MLPLPSYLTQAIVPDDTSLFTFGIRKGEVLELIYPDDKRSRSQRNIEYRVAVQCRNPDTNTATTREFHCLLGNLFGGVADLLTFTLRADPNGLDDKGIGKGSKVLLACIDGAETEALIIGGVREERDTEAVSNITEEEVEALGKKLRDRGHYLRGQFNGVHMTVTKIGTFCLEHLGPTDIDGKPADSGVHSRFLMLGDGSFLVGTQDKADQPLDFSYPRDLDKFPLRVHVDNNKKRIVLAAKNGVDIAGDTEPLPLFGTYRDAEQQHHKTMAAQLRVLQATLTSAAAMFQAIQAALSIPIAGPVAAAPLAGQVGTQLNLAAQAVNQMARSIQQFEKKPNNFVSQINRNG